MVAGGGVLGERFFSRDYRKPAWHHHGTQFDIARQLTAVEAYTEGNMEVPIRTFPLAPVEFVDGIWRIVANPIDQSPLVYEDRQGIFRWPIAEHNSVELFDVVSDHYLPISNLELCEAFDRAKISDIWPVESIGLLGKGEVFFITFDAGEWDVKGDPQNSYLFCVNGLDGRSSMNFGVTEVRMVCKNTVRLGLELASVNISISHTRRAKETLEFWSSIIPMIKLTREKTRETWRRMAEFKLTQDQTVEVFDVSWPDPKMPEAVRAFRELKDAPLTDTQVTTLEAKEERWLYYCGRQAEQRKAAETVLEKFNDEIAQRELAGTAYAVANAVSELANYAHGHNNRRPTSILIGDRQEIITNGISKIMSFDNFVPEPVGTVTV